MDIKAGSLFANRFRLLERIPGGNRTQVWRVEDAKKGNAVFALKLFESDKELDPVIVQLLTNEFLSMSLKHTNLLMPASFAASGSVPYLVLPYMEKGSLRGLLQRSPAGGRVGEKQIVPFLAQIASGLAVLHKNNFVHQDIAPENIFLGEGGVFLLGDFGISRILHNTLSHEVGPNKIFHIAYASPERFISRSANPPDDIFSVGVVLVEMAMGKVPFDGQGGKPLLEEQEPRTYLDLNFSDEFIEIVQSCLQRNPDKRPTAAELEKWALSFTPLSPDELRAARAEKARKEKEAEEAKARRAEEIKKQTELQRKSKEDVDRRIREAGEKKAAKTKPQKTLADYVPGAAAELAAEKEQRAREEAARSEQEQKAREEAERKLREATERRIREETEKKVRQETERALREEAERRAREEKERRAREEAERKAREEAERQQRRAFEEQLKKELDSKLQEELSRIRSAAETQLQEAERLSQELAEQRARAEAERKHLAEEQQRLREEAERNAREETERRAREEAERKEREEAERRVREEAERQAREEAERHAREEAERQAREEAERQEREEA